MSGGKCLNGHEHLKHQLAKEGIVFEALDNGLLSYADPRRAQALLSALVLFRLLPRGFTHADLKAHLALLEGVAVATITAAAFRQRHTASIIPTA